MHFGAGVLAFVAAPLAAGALGASVASQVNAAQQAAADYAERGRSAAVSTLRLDHQPDEYGDRLPGEIAIHQRASTYEQRQAVFGDHQGNLYSQDEATGQLSVLPLIRRWPWERADHSDWLDSDQRGHYQNMELYLNLK